MANLPLTEIVVPGSQDVLELAPDLTDEVTALQGAVSTLNTDVSNIPNGTYPNLTAGSILTNKYDVDTTPYLYRALPYRSKRLEDVIVGGSVVWNQLAKEIITTNWSAYNSNETVTDNVLTFTATAQYGGVKQLFPLLKSHKYLYMFEAKASASASLTATIGDDYYFTATKQKTISTSWASYAVMLTTSTSVYSASAYFGFRNDAGSNWATFDVRNTNFIDLTAMFGSTIADYVYTLEQGTTGAGVAWLKARGFFTKPYYEYDTGTIKSVEATAHVTRGVNAWDEEWEVGQFNSATGQKKTNNDKIRSKNYIPVVPNTTYYYKNGSGFACDLFEYDADKNFIVYKFQTQNVTFTTGSDTYFINISPSSSYGTTYKNDICINISNPTINGKYFPYEEHTYPLGDVVLRGIPKLVNNELIYDGDTYTHDGAVQRNTIFRAYQAGDESLVNALTDGTNTVVYSANASTETTTPFEQYQICETGGTEEYTTTNDVPVGHDTKYFTDVIGNIEDIPAPPTADGTYTLKVTVSSGVPTYAWV